MSINRIAAIVSSALVGIIILSGLYLSGSPGEQRLLRLDERRVRDLGQLAMVLQIRYQQDGRLPGALTELVDGQQLARLPRDPETDTDYEYRPADNRFELCTNFNRPSPNTRSGDFWLHPGGHHCFSFDATRSDVLFNRGIAPALPVMP